MPLATEEPHSLPRLPWPVAGCAASQSLSPSASAQPQQQLIALVWLQFPACHAVLQQALTPRVYLARKLNLQSTWERTRYSPRPFPPLSAVQLGVPYRFHQTAGTAMELPAPGPGLAGHSEGHRPGSPRGAAVLPTGHGLPRPGATVDGREAAVEFLAGLGSFQPKCGDGLREPASAAGRGRGRGTWPGERGGRMASLEEGAQACHCQCLWTHKGQQLLGTVRPREVGLLAASFQLDPPAWNSSVIISTHLNPTSSRPSVSFNHPKTHVLITQAEGTSVSSKF